MATLHADGVSLGDIFGDGEQLRHRFPGPAGVVLIESGDYYSDSSARKVICYIDKLVIKKLSFINSYNFGVWLDAGEQFGGRANVCGFMTHLGVGDDVVI